ncbi:MAG: hypothetical protein KatS3mg019_0354 [Fimbriimonadales bacterium]|nr:MAG: hypothetical protein KatS3mg019_0354 [Fimbriimonadales bacterium]
MRFQVRSVVAITGCAMLIGWLTGCGGGSSTSNSSATPSNPTNPNLLPPNNRLRLYQHGDEFEYVITGVAYLRGERYEVSGIQTIRYQSIGAGVMRVTFQTTLTLRRGSVTIPETRLAIYDISQDRQTREVTLIGYLPSEDSPTILSTLPYRVVRPGIWNENSTFSCTVDFQDNARIQLTMENGTIESVATYAGTYGCYRTRYDYQFDFPAPFTEYIASGPAWFSPQLGEFTRMELTESDRITVGGETLPIETRLTYLLRRTNVSVNNSTP